MKTILVIATFLATVVVSNCSGPRELQAEMVSAELIRIDTAFRYASNPQQMLTWTDDNHVQNITFAPLNNSFLLGSKMIVLVKRWQ